MKIVVLDGYTLNPGDISWERIERVAPMTVYKRTPAAKICERVGDAEIVFTNKTPLDRELFEKKPNLKYVGVLATGYNVVDTAAAKEFGVTVTNIPTYGTDAVAQFAFALILEVCHNVGLHSASVKAGEWEESPDFCYWKTPLIELAGKTLGVVGFGRIGRRVAEIALAFGMRVLAHDAYEDKTLENDRLAYAPLGRLFAESDIISLHCPLTDKTKGMINTETIAGMKDGVIIINTSRGPLVVEEDLAEALATGKVYAAGVDVVSAEPITDENPLIHSRHCFITPHIAWAPVEARRRLMDIAAENLEAFLAGRPQNTVNA